MIAALIDEFLKRHFEDEPTQAVHMGLHQFDGMLPDYSPAALEKRVHVAHDFCRRLAAEPVPAPGTGEWLDACLFARALESIEFRIERLRWWETNPLYYSHACDTSGYVKRRYAPEPERARAAAKHLRGLPAILRQAQRNLTRRLPRTRVETAISVFAGHIKFLEENLLARFTALADAERRDLEAGLEAALLALRQFTAFLKESLERAGENPAIGEQNFKDLLRIEEGVEVDLTRLLKLGEEELKRNREALRETAKQVDPALTPAEILAAMKRESPPAAELVPQAKEILRELRRFVVERELVTIPADQDCIVEETPPFYRWAFAMLDAPGPYERAAPDAFYYITPPEESWSREKQKQWLTQFERNTLTMVSIHEAWPGHFLHWLHFRNAPTAMTRVGDAYSFWEAWAHYSEELMLEQGYGAGDGRLRLAQLVEALIRNVRYVTACRMHGGDMTVDEARKLFRDQAFLEEAPALKEAERGTFDPGFLNYTLGKMLLKKLRDDCRAAQGASFRLRAFHDAFLSYGAPPIPLVRRMMLPGEERPAL